MCRHKKALLRLGQWASKRGLDKGPTKRLDLREAVGVRGLALRQAVEVFGDMVRDFNRRARGGFIPGLGYSDAPFVTDAAVIGWEGGVDHESRRGVIRGQIARRDRLNGAVRRLPLECDGGRFIPGGLEEIQAQRIPASADEPERGLVLTEFTG